ncbi:hypothetical protein DFAR_3060021 [Desulfarculales bacterium]
MNIIYHLGVFVKNFFKSARKKISKFRLTPLPTHANIGGMKNPKPLAIKIPGDYAEKLGIHFTTLSKINAGIRGMKPDKACLLLMLSRGDERLKGLTFYDLCPDIVIAHQFLYKTKLPPRLRG